MPLVTGDDELGFGGERAGEDVIVVGIAGDARDLRRFGKLHELDVIGEQRGVGADPLQLRREGGPGDDLGEFFE